MSELDLSIHYRNPDMPAIVFIHGLGMDKNIWLNPFNSRILGGKLPLTILLGEKPEIIKLKSSENFKKLKLSSGKPPEKLHTLLHRLKEKDFPVITWSQKRPAETIDRVVAELNEILEYAKNITKNDIIIITHSRGGLIARKYLMKNHKSIKALITIACPHKGSSLANIASYLSPIISFVRPLISFTEKNNSSTTIKRLIDFINSEALKELLPESPFFKTLNDEPKSSIKYISVGGTNPSLLRIYKYNLIKESAEIFAVPEEFFIIPDSLKKIIPDNLFPNEWKTGKGDGLVSTDSARFPWDCEHFNFNANHASILFDSHVIDFLVKKIEIISETDHRKAYPDI